MNIVENLLHIVAGLTLTTIASMIIYFALVEVDVLVDTIALIIASLVVLLYSLNCFILGINGYISKYKVSKIKKSILNNTIYRVKTRPAIKNQKGNMTERITCPYCKVEFDESDRNQKVKKGDVVVSCPQCSLLIWLEGDGWRQYRDVNGLKPGCRESEFMTDSSDSSRGAVSVDNLFISDEEAEDDDTGNGYSGSDSGPEIRSWNTNSAFDGAVYEYEPQLDTVRLVDENGHNEIEIHRTQISRMSETE